MKKINKIIILLIISGVIILGIYKLTQKPEPEFIPDEIVSQISEENLLIKESDFVQQDTNLTNSSKPKYFGNDAIGDLNRDGKEDIAFLFTQKDEVNTYYYLLVVLDMNGAKTSSKPMLIGTNISPQSSYIYEGLVVVNYSVSDGLNTFVGKTLRAKLDPTTMELGEVIQNFEGEANPQVMNLQMKKWLWIKNIYNDKREVLPRSDKFSITFDKLSFSASTDCNGIGGEYVTKQNKMYFSAMVSTLMYCENSQENEFRQMLETTEAYELTSKGELVLYFTNGSAIFK